MLQHIKNLYGSKLNALDGDIGTIEDFYFDDETWNIRYLVAETGTWLVDWQVLISPNSLRELDLDNRILSVKLSRKQIENSPPIARHRPVSRQFETEYHAYYGWPYYWSSDAPMGFGGNSLDYSPLLTSRDENEETRKRDDIHLRSACTVAGYEIEASDGTIGHVSDFLVDDRTWAIRELVVEAGHWYSGKEILIPIGKIKRISTRESRIHVYLTKRDIEKTDENRIAYAHPL